ncbi:PQQ-dependent sugar dehydrogenase [Paracoccus saliphilus]|uniref:Glucose/arabinose dehydrogenase, beta-propeller fold n=1 Tax=Paracoccus saliphilus TaxID=405559 RepID=A0AA45W319_9RHOB|nr:PQQ-dependent sugar dehydrogenase [Paracoccus saliphilus]WCR04961.1 PQQ-dependent sugar dehydrogenase [Paracoccus saliphilus]SIS72001.1 Glucose/arabinose dehydrogenase, beta-propeller fold [Paracoccus saliphilus]
MPHDYPHSAIRLTILATTGVFAGAVAAQDFNDVSPNAQGQTPAFENQTRAPVLPDMALQQQVVAEGLEHPWGMAQLPDGSWLVTERPGRLRLIGGDGALSDPVAGLPRVDSRDQGGLLDVAIADDFAETRQVWLSFAQPREGGKTASAVATGVLSADGSSLEGTRVIWQQEPAWASTKHYGSRLVFDGQGGLFVTTGERSVNDARVHSQNVATTLGKVVRIDPQSGAPMGQPGVEGALPEIWSWGHRNMQGATMGPDGALWTIEHGPRGGDELNRPQAGRNYGWPRVTYGVEYSGQPVGDGITRLEGTEQPVYYWDPVIAPGGMSFYDGAMFPDWQGDLLIGGMQAAALVRLELDGGRVTGEARHLQGIGRVRDVDIAADGAVMLLTDQSNGALVRVTPGQ